MDELFSDQNIFKSNEFESFNENEVNYNKRIENKLKTTTIEKVISPIQKPVALDQHLNYDNIDHHFDQDFGQDFDQDFSFNKSKTNRKYPSLKKSMSLEFSPIMRSTPKPSKTRKSRKHLKRTSISLWDKAIDKNVILFLFI
jgi:hypothetical protein